MINFDLKDRVAIVTGGAQGFGLAITERFIASGASVVIWDIDEEAIKIATKKINSDKLSYQIVDVGNYQYIEKNLSLLPFSIHQVGNQQQLYFCLQHQHY